MGKRGPKAKQGIKRQPNGRPSETAEFVRARKNARADEEQWNTMSAAMMARHRLYELPYPPAPDSEKARREAPHLLDQFAGSFVGRCYLAGQLTRMQVEAAQIYHQERSNYSTVCGGPKAAGAVNLNATKGAPNDIENLEFAARAREAYDASYKAIWAKQSQIRLRGQLFASLTLAVIEDKPLPHLLPWLRIALDALAVHYRLDRENGKAAA